jgi:hypothetical protein
MAGKTGRIDNQENAGCQADGVQDAIRPVYDDHRTLSRRSIVWLSSEGVIDSIQVPSDVSLSP